MGRRSPLTRAAHTVALIGHPVAHSLSPRLFARAFAAARLRWRYRAFDVPPRELRDAVALLRRSRLAGFNVTHPHKERMAPFLDGLASSARASGAVNAVVRRGERLIGHNFDAAAFGDDLRALSFAAAAGRGRCVLLGAGGAARACASALGTLGAPEVLLASRDVPRARRAAAELSPHHPRTRFRATAWTSLSRAICGASLLVNATPVGWGRGDRLPLADGSLRPPLRVYDLVYRRGGTDLLRRAARARCESAGGLGMLARQAARSFRLWTGRRPPASAFRVAR